MGGPGEPSWAASPLLPLFFGVDVDEADDDMALERGGALDPAEEGFLACCCWDEGCCCTCWVCCCGCGWATA